MTIDARELFTITICTVAASFRAKSDCQALKRREIRKGGSLKPRLVRDIWPWDVPVMDAYLVARYCGRETAVCPGPTAGNRLIPL